MPDVYTPYELGKWTCPDCHESLECLDEQFDEDGKTKTHTMLCFECDYQGSYVERNCELVKVTVIFSSKNPGEIGKCYEK